MDKTPLESVMDSDLWEVLEVISYKDCKDKNRERNARNRVEKVEKINITGIAVEKIYYVETDEPGFESLVRYDENRWFVLYGGKELPMDPAYVEEDFQKLLLLNSISFN